MGKSSMIQAILIYLVFGLVQEGIPTSSGFRSWSVNSAMNMGEHTTAYAPGSWPLKNADDPATHLDEFGGIESTMFAEFAEML